MKNDSRTSRSPHVVDGRHRRYVVRTRHVVCLVVLFALQGRALVANAEWSTTTDRSLLNNIALSSSDTVHFLGEIRNYNITQRDSLWNIESNSAYIADLLDGSTPGGTYDQLTTIISYVDELETLVSMIQGQTDTLEALATNVRQYTLNTSNYLRDITDTQLPEIDLKLDFIDQAITDGFEENKTVLEDILESLDTVEQEITETADDPNNPAPINPPQIILDPLPNKLDPNFDSQPDVEPISDPDFSIEESPTINWTVNDTTPNLDFVVETSRFSGVAGVAIQDFTVNVDEAWIRDTWRPIAGPILIAIAGVAAMFIVWEELRRYG